MSSTRIKFSDNSSSSSSDEEDAGSRNDPTNISKSRGCTDVVFTTAEKYFVRNSFDQEMDFQNSNDFKLTSTSEQATITTSAFGNDNWADFANFNVFEIIGCVRAVYSDIVQLRFLLVFRMSAR